MYSPPVDHDPVGIFQQSQVKEKTTTRLKDVQQYQLVTYGNRVIDRRIEILRVSRAELCVVNREV